MYGIIGSFGTRKFNDFAMEQYDITSQIVEQSFENELLSLKRKTIDKFMSDKVFYEDKDYLIIVEGIIYNYHELEQQHNILDRGRLLIKLYHSYHENFVNKLNGNFSILLYIKKTNKLLLFASHTAYRPLFYYLYENNILFSTDLHWLYKTLLENKTRLTLNIDGAYCLLSYGYMLDNITLVSNVYKLLPGHYIAIDGSGNFTDNIYLDWNKITISKLNYDELIERADQLFCKAVNSVYEKDREYGYKHICTLSGGLDSRNVAFVADRLNYKNQCFITMAQSESADIKISSQMADFLNGEHIVYELNNGNYLKEIEKAIKMNAGTITYPGLIHMYKLLEKIRLDDYGLIHTGEIGDFLFGDTLLKIASNKDYRGLGAFSLKLIDKVSEEFSQTLNEKYKSAYEFVLYNRVLNSSVNGWYAAQNLTDSSSAFVDKLFMEFALSLPAEYKVNSRIYTDWMKRYIPDACLFKRDSNNSFPGSSNLNIFINRCKRKIIRLSTHKNFKMNPHEQWYQSNEGLRNFFDDSFNSMIGLLSFNDELKSDCRDLWLGTVNEKMQVLTLLYAIKEYKIIQ